MELTHGFTVASDVETTWAHFMDLERVGSCFPGAQVTEVSGDDFAGTVKVKLGPIALQYAGTGRFVERDHAAHLAVIEAKGKDSRGNGTAGATVTMRLHADPGGGTRAELVTDLAVTGKPAQFGRGVMQDVSDKLLGQFLTCLEHQLAGDFDGQASAPPTAAALGAVASADALARASAPPDDAEPTGGAAEMSAHVLGALARGNALAASAALADGAPAPEKPVEPGPASRVGLGSAARPPYQPPSASTDALDLGGAVWPVLAKTYGPYVVAGLVGLVAGVLVGRRRRR